MFMSVSSVIDKCSNEEIICLSVCHLRSQKSATVVYYVSFSWVFNKNGNGGIRVFALSRWCSTNAVQRLSVFVGIY